ncbi:sulfate ABC transporter substrate-binding protein [Comamonas badia]|uniref:sulfate ABC transporter substrate-binding protein n=1 Tax=Comamonas badia TaxID=265291 RepID=UPI000402F945|nr:sulfate ABC transporter substrate-binding protein [Comamonas badia]
MVGKQWFQAMLAATLMAAGALAQAQAVGAVNGSAQAARAFFQETRAAFSAHESRAADASVGPGAFAFSTTTDIQTLAQLGVVAQDWARQQPRGAAPTASTIVFLVRAGNPKGIRDWSDLTRQEVHAVVSNPKLCNTGRYAYLAAWGSAREQGASDAQAAEFVGTLYRQAQVLAKGEREAVAAFAREGQGDVLIALESDAGAIRESAGGSGLAVVYPSASVLVENPVALAVHGASESQLLEARAYLTYLYTDEAQEIAARHGLRPQSAAVLARHAENFKAISTFPVAKYFGSLELAQKVHFSAGGRFDQIWQPSAPQLAAAGARVPL